MKHDDDDVEQLLRDIGRVDRAWSAPPEVEARVLAKWDATSSRGQPTRSIGWVRWMGGCAAAAALVAALLLTSRSRHSVQVGRDGSATIAAGSLPLGTHVDFIPLVAGDTANPVHIARVRLPYSALAAFGMPLADAGADGHVDAEVLVGEDAVAHSIRFVARK